MTAAVGAGGGGGPDVKTKQTESTLTAQLICNNWPRGVTVSTLDSESSDRGSNPREASVEPYQKDCYLFACEVVAHTWW